MNDNLKPIYLSTVRKYQTFYAHKTDEQLLALQSICTIDRISAVGDKDVFYEFANNWIQIHLFNPLQYIEYIKMANAWTVEHSLQASFTTTFKWEYCDDNAFCRDGIKIFITPGKPDDKNAYQIGIDQFDIPIVDDERFHYSLFGSFPSGRKGIGSTNTSYRFYRENDELFLEARGSKAARDEYSDLFKEFPQETRKLAGVKGQRAEKVLVVKFGAQFAGVS